jgi:hypothetical protein
MNTRTNIAMTSLAVLLTMMGLFFGGLSFAGGAQPQQAASETICKLQPPAWAHACISRTQEYGRSQVAQIDGVME